MFFPRYLPLGRESEARRELASLRHSLDTASPLVVHGLRTGAISEYQGRRFFSLQRDITGLLRELIKNEESTRWQMKHAKAVKNAIRIGCSDLEAIYLTLSITTATHAMNEGDLFLERTQQRRKYLDQAMRPTTAYSHSGHYNRPSYGSHSRTNSSFED
ncbi:hypothetical protein FRC00_008919 [Tulasnella sp. 408]|nr:hypothetical protein FRC00_008919 [Tulasnella sp. 408]